MTEREFFTKALAINGLADDMVAYATAAIEKLDAKNEKRKNTLTKTQKENIGIKDAIYNLLVADGAKIASVVGESLGITTQKASRLCKALVDEQRATVTDIKVKGKGTVKQYTAILTTETAEDTATT